ncbi:MAG: dependent oxidoreductase [Thermomicrobiales bacterium]|nr:dependent oxidoreductase [Thermomicrobiales bacterium]
MERIETVVVGGGQAGLATSYHLTQLGREHVVLEQAAHAAPVWSNERWDTFTLVTPNWATRMPGAVYDGPDPDGFMSRDEVIAYFARYVDRFHLPVQGNTRVTAVEPLDSTGYRVLTGEQTIEARNVVMATGFFQKPKIPSFAGALSPDLVQLHSSQYRNPESLPPGAVLVVGSAQSGCQIAEELYQRGRQVFLCTGSAGRVPRRYRGKDVIAWLQETGFFDLTPEQLPPGMSKFEGIPHFSGTNGGHTINLHQFARDGVTLLGHLRGANGTKVSLAPDLHENLAKVDQFEREVLNMLDGYIQKNGIDAPEEDVPELRDGFAQPIIADLDLKAAGISTVIWAMGYTFDYSLVKLPVRDGDGFPLQRSGVTDVPGLYFVGMPWMPSEKSGFLIGVGDAAGSIASHIAANGRGATGMPARGSSAVVTAAV